MAVDVCPYPIDWNNKERFYHFAGYVKGIADSMGIKIRWGGDWDGDTVFDDQSFHDLPHFELLEPRVKESKEQTDLLPDGPTDEEVDASLEEIEGSIFDE